MIPGTSGDEVLALGRLAAQIKARVRDRARQRRAGRNESRAVDRRPIWQQIGSKSGKTARFGVRTSRPNGSQIRTAVLISSSMSCGGGAWGVEPTLDQEAGRATVEDCLNALHGATNIRDGTC